jgi:hypothetical protein
MVRGAGVSVLQPARSGIVLSRAVGVQSILRVSRLVGQEVQRIQIVEHERVGNMV